MAKKNKYQIGQTVNFPRVNKWPSEQRFIVLGYELRTMHEKKEYVYHLAHYDFSRMSFQTRSHVLEKLLKPTS